jgi:transcriptional repressor NrdR
MNCIYCSCDKTEVIETRESADGGIIRRRRFCPECKRRFTTYEKPERYDLKVIKKNGELQDFDKEKLLDSIHKACKGQDVTEVTLIKISDQIEDEILSLKKPEISAHDIAKEVLKKLLKLDEVAFIRYASYQYDVHSIEDIVELKDKTVKDISK